MKSILSQKFTNVTILNAHFCENNNNKNRLKFDLLLMLLIECLLTDNRLSKLIEFTFMLAVKIGLKLNPRNNVRLNEWRAKICAHQLALLRYLV